MFTRVRGDLYFNFTSGYHRDGSKNLALNVVGVNPADNSLQVQSITLSTLFDLKEPALRWYYWVLIIIGGILIVGSLGMLVFAKDEKDKDLADDDDYVSVMDIEERDSRGNIKNVK